MWLGNHLRSRNAVYAFALAVGACGGGGGDAPSSAVALSPMAALGKTLFSDRALSSSGQQSCASCHLPSRAFASAGTAPVMDGGPNGGLPGLRNTPSLTYALYAPPFHFEVDGTPVGGFFRDGRVNTLAEQAMAPFLNPFEMANKDAGEVVSRLRQRPYLDRFTSLFGSDVLNQSEAALNAVGRAIATYETEAPEFHRFDSKFDAYTDGKVSFSASELNGLRLFNDTTKGNCASCHPSQANGGVPALFTDFTYDNLGVPRNAAIPANDDANQLFYVPHNGTALGDPDHVYYDLGLCGPLRTDLAAMTSLCGAFKVPSLRNVALTAPYFHNGEMATLHDVVRYYVTRNSDATNWYRAPDGMPDRLYNDLPAWLKGNVNTHEMPYIPAAQPALSATEIDDVVAFLCTLTDGFDPKNPGAYNQPDQCPNP